MKHSKINILLQTTIFGACVGTASIAVAGASGAPCVVNNTLDSAMGSPSVAGSLRDCLDRVVPGDSVIFDPVVFDLVNSDAATIINVTHELPPLDDGSVTIDASNRRVTVNGSGTNNASGLRIMSGGNHVMGLTIVGFDLSGIQISSGVGNTIGGSRAIGGGPNGQGLRLSNNGAFGLEITGVGTSSSVVKGCWIGLDASGSSAQPNLAGVAIQGGSHGNTIGSVIADEANVISGNAFEGVTVADAGSDDNSLIGNVIGASAEAIPSRSAVANGSAGVFLSRGTQGSQVGGSSSGEANVIAFNGGNGVEVRAADSRRNSIRSNSIGRNTRGGIALFDGSNDAIRPPTIVSIQSSGESTDGTPLLEYTVSGVTPRDGTIEIFNDSGDQGETLLGDVDALTGAWTTTVGTNELLNVSATLTDALGNTSRFGVFGLTAIDTDDDGVSDSIEGLAGTDPDDPLDTPAYAGSLSIGKMSIKLNFSTASKDSLKVTTSLALPTDFVVDGATVGIEVAGHSETFTLDSKGKAFSELSKIMVKTSSAKGPFIKYGIKQTMLQAILASSGLADRTTEGGEFWVLPVAVTTGSSVYSATVEVKYTAKQGKSGSAKQSK